ncbi:hypothetical protein EK21DRAFT_77971 [Setomelanomma holmii]|uniref:F-box domain-containing protein n=1 Tax=Setomelanomma holmii TaxID=210430 RepID=A0A9P4GXJ0_9PLEO|nr:hypothetical protein EK21DRAFT_77971 [Setomelanomma holmii]
METNALVAAFRNLPTLDSRQVALSTLVNELTSDEWRKLGKVITARSFQFDIIGNLPVELVAQVFVYLGPSAPYRWQSVSRGWQRALRSPHVLKKCLRPWLEKAAPQTNEYGIHALKAKHIQAFRRGEPNQGFTVKLHDPHSYVILVEDRLVWASESRTDYTARLVCVFNIQTWSLHTFRGDAREKIHRLVASDELVGFATGSNLFYAWDFETRTKRTFMVPNATLFQNVTCRERTIACAGCLEKHVFVYIWDFDSQLAKYFTIAYDSPLLVYPTHGRRITVFADQRCSAHNSHGADKSINMSTTIRHSQFTYGGDLISGSETVLEGLSATRFYSQNNRFTPISRSGKFRIAVLHMCLQFDEKLNRFTEPQPFSHPGQLWAMASSFWWEDVFLETFNADLNGPSRSSNPPALVHVGTGYVQTVLEAYPGHV